MPKPSAAIPLTAIILSYNEEVNINACLAAIKQVDEVVIVDSLSTDDTLARATAERPKVRILSHAFKDFGDQRNWALDHCTAKHPWILFIDADEYCTSEFLDEVTAFIASPSHYVGAFVAGKNYFLGRWLKYSTFYPSYQLRLLKFGAVRYRKEGHGQKEVTEGPLYLLKEGWRHEGFSKGIFHWIERHNRYSTEETALLNQLRSRAIPWRALMVKDPILRRRAQKIIAAKVPFRPFVFFIYSYFFRRGFLDGRPGLLFCMLRAAQEIHIVAKLKELQFKAGVEK